MFNNLKDLHVIKSKLKVLLKKIHVPKNILIYDNDGYIQP